MSFTVEEQLQQTTVNWLHFVSPWYRDRARWPRWWSDAGRAPFFWCHIPNQRGARGQRRILSALGVIAGAPDLVFAGQVLIPGLEEQGPELRFAAIEKKAPGGRLKPAQKRFRSWCLAAEVPYAVTVEPEEDAEMLRRWGFLPAGAPMIEGGTR